MSKLLIFAFLIGQIWAEKIIIIGAGAAGIAAASRLLDHNITDFKIIEAEDWIGGRIRTFHLGDAFVELGAQYVHGEEGNEVYKLAKDYLQPEGRLDNVHVYYSGHERTEDNFTTIVEVLYEEVGISGNPNISIGEAFMERYNSTVLSKYKDNPEMLNYAKDFIRNGESYVLGWDGAFSWFEPTISQEEYKDCEGDQSLSWNGRGYKTILDILLKNFPNKTGYDIEKQTLLEKTVSKISLNESVVNVRLTDGSEYVADHVIFTPSLGVLKHEHEEIFEPKLSSDKKTVIENLGFDGVMKVIFEFPNAWWGDKDYFVFVWTQEEKKNLIKKVPYGPTKNGDHWLSWFYVLGIAPNNPTILIGWIVGPMVPEIEKLTEEEMKNGTLYAIKNFLRNDFNVTEPLKVIHSKWYTNPNFRGTYSFETVEMKKKNIYSAQRTLLRPVLDKSGVPKILFAGEATNPTRFGTVDGAIVTGYREADRLVKILKTE